MSTPPLPSSEPTYWELEALLSSEGEEVWSLFCHAQGACGAEQVEDAPVLRMRYFFLTLPPEWERPAPWLTAFRRGYPAAPPPLKLKIQARPGMDWQGAWRRYFQPVAVGQTLLVTPPWASASVEGRMPLLIQPGQGFGTGRHPSTVLALELLEGWLGAKGRPAPAAMLDVGTGSGILAIAAALWGVPALWALDSDGNALAEVANNFALNQLPRSPHLVRGGPECLKGCFPLVAANITAPLLQTVAPVLTALTAPGGMLVLSGMLVEEAQALLECFAHLGCQPVHQVRREGWQACRLLRQNSP